VCARARVTRALQRVAVRCSMLQSVLQYVSVYCSYQWTWYVWQQQMLLACIRFQVFPDVPGGVWCVHCAPLSVLLDRKRSCSLYLGVYCRERKRKGGRERARERGFFCARDLEGKVCAVCICACCVRVVCVCVVYVCVYVCVCIYVCTFVRVWN